MEQLLLPLLLMLVVAIPLVMGTRKQKKAMAQQQELQKSLSEGDRVMTTSGMYATVADTSGDNTIDLEIAPGVITTWLRQAVREKVQPEVEDVVEDVVEVDDTPADDVIEATVVETEDVEDTTPAKAETDDADRADEKQGAKAEKVENGKK